jgi:hypothetical protein
MRRTSRPAACPPGALVRYFAYQRPMIVVFAYQRPMITPGTRQMSGPRLCEDPQCAKTLVPLGLAVRAGGGALEQNAAISALM